MAIWACWNGYLGNGSVAVLVEADDEQSARVAAAQALADDPGAESAHGDPTRWTSIDRAERLTLPHVFELD